jgi:hypothetical protein
MVDGLILYLEIGFFVTVKLLFQVMTKDRFYPNGNKTDQALPPAIDQYNLYV